MEFVASLPDLKKAVDQAAVTIGSASANLQEVLRNFLIQVEEDSFLIVGTDLEISMISRKTANVTKPGRILVEAKKLADILRYASGTHLTFRQEEDGKITLQSGSSKWVLLARAAGDYPEIEDFKSDQKYVTLNRKNFIASIQRVAHSVCDDETRKNLTAVAISSNRILAANGKIASSYELTDLTAPGSDAIEANLPSRSISPLTRVLANFEEEAFEFQEGTAFYYFKVANNVFSIRKSTINFPVKKTFDMLTKFSTNELEVLVNREGLIGAIERVRLNASEDSRAIHMNILESKIELRSKDEVGNYATEEIQCIRPNSKELNILCFFNWLNLLDSIKSMVSENIALRFANDFGKSALFLGETNYKSIVLPIQAAFETNFN